jgi:flagellar basal body-associated protein FliL
MTDEEKSDRRRTLIIVAIIILAVWILAGFLWYFIMAERWESGPQHIGYSGKEASQVVPRWMVASSAVSLASENVRFW